MAGYIALINSMPELFQFECLIIQVETFGNLLL